MTTPGELLRQINDDLEATLRRTRLTLIVLTLALAVEAAALIVLAVKR